MLALSSHFLGCFSLAIFFLVSCDHVHGHYRQAIPLALVQADTLAIAKQPSNTNKSNTTANSTSSSNNATEKAKDHSLLLKSVGLQETSSVSSPSRAVWRLDHLSYSSYESPSDQVPVAQDVKDEKADGTNDCGDSPEDFERCSHAQEILVGPLKSLPDNPNGNGPQEMKLKGPGGYQKKKESTKKKTSLRTIKRFKRNYDDDDDNDDGVDDDKLTLRIIKRSQSHATKPKHEKEKLGLKRDFIGMPYIPNRGGFDRQYFRLPYDDSKIMEDEMSSLPGSQPIGMASDFQPTDYGPIEDEARSGLSSKASYESPGPDPLRLQNLYERSSNWEPVGTTAHFSPEEEYNYGLPDAHYDKSIENDAQNVDNRFVSNFFNQEGRNSQYGRSYQEKPDVKHRTSLLDSLGIGQSEIDQRYLTEAKNIQEYLSRSEQQGATRSLGHDSLQHNNIQLGLSPELVRENPNVWNMIDSASYTPMSEHAESLFSNSDNSEGPVLQSQNSMGRVFVPLNLQTLSNRVRDEIRQHYTVPKQPVPFAGVNADKAVSKYPNILKSFYPNVPYQTVQGASLNPPDMSNMGFRSMINHPLQQFMQPTYQSIPMMLPFSGMPYPNMLQDQQPVWNPMPAPMMSGPFQTPMMVPGPENSQEMASERHDVDEKPNRIGPGTLTVKSTDDGDNAKEQQPKSTDFEELLNKGIHNTVERVNVQGKPKNDSLIYLRETVSSDLANMQTAIKDVLNSAVMAGNITSDQSKAITEELTRAFVAKEKNKTLTGVTRSETADLSKKVIAQLETLKSNVARIEGNCRDEIADCKRFKDAGICPFVGTFMHGACAKTCDSCNPKTKSRIQELVEKRKEPMFDFKAPNGPSMYLDFENISSSNAVKDMSGNHNDAVMLKGAKLSGRKLGTCGRGAELNDGDISWDGKTFHNKPIDAVTLAMWVKVHKGGTINWFASGDQGTTFFTSTKDATIPAKVWTHVTGSYDSATGLSSIFINGALIKQTKQRKGQKLVQDWLVNGIGHSFGDDSMHYVDELYIFNRALKPIEVQALYHKCTFNRMVIHYGFQKGNNSLILDQSGLQNDAIPIGGAAQKEDCERCGSCLDLTHGPNPTLKVERISLSSIPTRSVSIALWVSLNSTKGVHDVFITQGPLDGSGYRLRIIEGKIRWSVGTDNGETIFDFETKSVTVPETLWTHIIATYDKESGNVEIFVNGVSKLTEIVDKKDRKLLPRDWETEAKLGDKTFNGLMDEFIMYNWAVDESEATYVRKYCADHPKLVRFIVRVPLTKRDKVLKGAKIGAVSSKDKS